MRLGHMVARVTCSRSDLLALGAEKNLPTLMTPARLHLPGSLGGHPAIWPLPLSCCLESLVSDRFESFFCRCHDFLTVLGGLYD